MLREEGSPRGNPLPTSINEFPQALHTLPFHGGAKTPKAASRLSDEATSQVKLGGHASVRLFVNPAEERREGEHVQKPYKRRQRHLVTPSMISRLPLRFHSIDSQHHVVVFAVAMLSIFSLSLSSVAAISTEQAPVDQERTVQRASPWSAGCIVA